MIAKETITLHDETHVIAQVEKGEKYFIPDSVKVYNGNIDECLKEFEELKIKED